MPRRPLTHLYGRVFLFDCQLFWEGRTPNTGLGRAELPKFLKAMVRNPPTHLTLRGCSCSVFPCRLLTLQATTESAAVGLANCLR